MRGPESLEQLYARINASCFIPSPDPTGATEMPRPVKIAKGKEISFGKSKGGETRYPWDEWFNPDPKHFPNGVLLLEQSIGQKDDTGTVTTIDDKGKRDFEVDALYMRAKCKVAARNRYKVVETTYKDVDGNKLVDSIIIRTRDMTDDEKVKEDILRAEDKKALKEKKANKKVAASNGPATISPVSPT